MAERKRRYSTLDAADLDEKRFIRNANRTNAERDRDAPLFAYAGLVEYTTPEERQARVTRMAEDWHAHMAGVRTEQQQQLVVYIEWLAELGLDAHAELASSWLARHGKLGHMDYVLDFLNQLLATHLGLTSGQVHDQATRITERYQG